MQMSKRTRYAQVPVAVARKIALQEGKTRKLSMVVKKVAKPVESDK
jgi:hypothetical protein